MMEKDPELVGVWCMFIKTKNRTDSLLYCDICFQDNNHNFPEWTIASWIRLFTVYVSACV